MRVSLTSLVELGFMEGGIVEVVASTVDGYGRPNLAAMGASLKEGLVALRPFKDTATYANLSSTGEAVLNLTDDPAIFAHAALKLRLQELELEPARAVKPPRVKGAYGFVEVVVESVEDGGERAEVHCRPIVVEAQPMRPKAYCRAGPAIIEALIHASRLEAFTRHGLDARKLLELIGGCRRLVHRVAPNTRYAELMEEVWRWSLLKLREGGMVGG